MKKLSCFLLLLSAACGCGSKNESGGANVAANQSPAAPAAAGTASATPSSALVTNGASTEPGEVVALFLDSLRRGDETTANSVLTAQAQTELAKTDYVIQPLGTPEGKYTIGRVGFVDGDTSTGLVECMWSEPNPVAGQPAIEMEIVCEVHKEAPGWRISGLAVKMAGTEETFVLDFENAQSLQAALEGATGQSAGASQTTATAGGQAAGQTATALPSGQAAPNALPPLPGGVNQATAIMPAGPAGAVPSLSLPPLPGNVPQQPADAATQIALPPALPSINR